MNDEQPEQHRVKIVGEPESVLVFNCPVIISRLDTGEIHGQVANLDGIESTAATEREVLQTIVNQFKKEMGKYIKVKQEPPWLEKPRTPLPDQVERMIPVHL